MGRTPRVTSQPTLRDVADLLRHLDRPQRLRNNALARALFRDEADATARVRALVRSALGGLSARGREIVERCDLAGERHAEVARSLCISERHFYRERSKALGALLFRITNAERSAAPEPHGPRAVAALSAFDVALDHAAALAQTGGSDVAAGLLERVAAAEPDVDKLVLVCCRLAEVLADAGRVAEARHWAGRAASFAASVPGAGVLGAEAAVACAQTLRVAGDEATAAPLAERSIVRLRAACVTAPNVRAREAFASAAILVAERMSEGGSWPSAARLYAEAREALDIDPRTRPIVRFRVARHLAVADLFEAERIDDGISALGTLLQRQLGAGLLAEACQTATTLAATHRVLSRPQAAAATLAPLLEVARSACAGESLAGALLEYAWTLVPRTSAVQPWDALTELRLHAAAGSFVHALSYLVEASALLARGRPLDALRAAHAAIEGLTLVRRWRYVGVALRVQALALEALGDLDGARLTISASLERLERSAHPASVSRARNDAKRLYASGSSRRQVT